MNKITSEGKCLFCGKTFKKAGINRHLARHLAKSIMQNPKGLSYHLKVELSSRWGSAPYFLSLWVDGEATMGELDDFLRKIWLECCGHMSSFRNPGARTDQDDFFDMLEAYDLLDKGKIDEYERMMEIGIGEVPKRRLAKEALYKDLKLEYQYDFGSTTELQITVLGEYPIQADAKVVLLSRNEPLQILCEQCNKVAAVQLCTVCYDYSEEGLFCKKCAEKHAKTCDDFADYAAMPVVNSPRMGVCGYNGGSIDTERDRKGNLKIVK